MPARVCLHCLDPARPVNRPSGLCWSCFYAPGVRDAYPVSGSKFARRGVGNGTAGLRPDPVPTTALPGTPAKVCVLAARAERGEHLWHDLDGRVGTAEMAPGDLNPRHRRVTHNRPRVPHPPWASGQDKSRFPAHRASGAHR